MVKKFKKAIADSSKNRNSTDWHEFMTRPRADSSKNRNSTDWFEFMRTPRSGQKVFLTPNEEQVVAILRSHGGEMSIFDIAREGSMTTDYTRLICESLGGRDIIDVSARGICRLPRRDDNDR